MRRQLVRGSRGLIIIVAIVVLVGLIAFVGLLVDGDVSGALWSLLAAGGVGLLGIPALTYGIYTDGDRLIVKHDWGTSKVAWKDIDRFEVRGIRGLGLWQRDGEWVLLQQMPGQKRRAAQAINVLEREMAAHIGDQNT